MVGVAMGLAVLPLTVLLLYRRARSGVTRLTPEQREVRFALTPAFFEVEQEGTPVRHRWTAVVRVGVAADAYFLEAAKVAYVLPARAFSPEDWLRIRPWLRADGTRPRRSGCLSATALWVVLILMFISIWTLVANVPPEPDEALQPGE